MGIAGGGGGAIFERKGTVTKLIELKHKKLNSIEVTMVGDKFIPTATKNTAQKSPEPQKPSYLDIASKSINQDATSLLLQLKNPAQASVVVDAKLPYYSKRTSDKVKLLKTPQKPNLHVYLPPYSNKKGIKWMKKTYYAMRTSIIWLYERW